MEELTHIPLSKDRDDTLQLKDEEGDNYIVKSAYKKLLGTNQGEQNEIFKIFWKTRALPTTQHFAWKVILNRVGTKLNLRRKGIITSSTLCVMYGNAEESNSHLFFTCKIAKCVWKQCHIWVGNTSVSHNDPQYHFCQFELLKLSNKYNIIWGSIWMAILWLLWGQRNKTIFRNGLTYASKVFTLAYNIFRLVFKPYNMLKFFMINGQMIGLLGSN